MNRNTQLLFVLLRLLELSFQFFHFVVFGLLLHSNLIITFTFQLLFAPPNFIIYFLPISTFQNQFRRSMPEQNPMLQNQNLPSYHGSKEKKNANRIISKITSTRSATIHIKQSNKIRKESSTEEEKLKEAINQRQRKIEMMNLKEQQYLNEYDQMRKILKEALKANNQKQEESCRADINAVVKLIEAIGRSRSELRAEVIRLQKLLKQRKDQKI